MDGGAFVALRENELKRRLSPRPTRFDRGRFAKVTVAFSNYSALLANADPKGLSRKNRR